MHSLQSITDAWGKWIADKKGTDCRFTASTNYSSQSDLDDYHKYQCTAEALEIVYDGNSPPTGMADVAYELWYDNATNLDQNENFQYSSETKQSFSWTLSETLSIGVKVSATEGVPDVASSTQEVSVELDLTSTKTKSHEEDQTWEADTYVQVPAQSSLKCDMIINSQSYDIDFTQPVLIKGDVAIWFADKVAWNGGSDKHWLWFISIHQVLSDVIANNLANTSGYTLVSGGIHANPKGVFKGSQGVSVNVTTTQYPLRTAVAPKDFQPVATATIYDATMADADAMAAA